MSTLDLLNALLIFVPLIFGFWMTLDDDMIQRPSNSTLGLRPITCSNPQASQQVSSSCPTLILRRFCAIVAFLNRAVALVRTDVYFPPL
jgi:hypothetical protein